MDVPAAKGVVRDLGALNNALQADETNGDAVKQLVAKLGKETVAMASKGEGKKADQVKELGEALAGMAEEG